MTTTRRSLAECRALAIKAARGAGCPWGMAEEAGHAIRRLEAHDLPGMAALADLFETPRRCACASQTGPAACGLAELAALSDAPPPGRTEYDAIAAPLLVAAAFIGQDGPGWTLHWPEGALACGKGGAALSGRAPSGQTTLSVAPAAATDATPDRARYSPESRPVNDDDWARLSALAALCNVPETEASRASGAGPAQSDQD